MRRVPQELWVQIQLHQYQEVKVQTSQLSLQKLSWRRLPDHPKVKMDML